MLISARLQSKAKWGALRVRWIHLSSFGYKAVESNERGQEWANTMVSLYTQKNQPFVWLVSAGVVAGVRIGNLPAHLRRGQQR